MSIRTDCRLCRGKEYTWSHGEPVPCICTQPDVPEEVPHGVEAVSALPLPMDVEGGWDWLEDVDSRYGIEPDGLHFTSERRR